MNHHRSDTLEHIPSRHTRATILSAALALFAVASPPSASSKKNTTPTLRWSEGQAGCTFSRDTDGKYRYELWTADFGAILAVDAQELQLVHKRGERFFSVHLTVRNRSTSPLTVDPTQATLEFVKHSKIIQPALDPESFAQKAQSDVDEIEHQTEREIEKHPERKEEREKFVQGWQKEVTELQDFLSHATLPAVQLDSSRTEISGWILFSTHSKWIGDWRKPEEFLFRIPLGSQIVEFPFALPAQAGDLILRQRSE
jgi:hypothetical protein